MIVLDRVSIKKGVESQESYKTWMKDLSRKGDAKVTV
jgi:hypothetical protein